MQGYEPVGRLKKKEIVNLWSKKCIAHNVQYIFHRECYIKENPSSVDKVGFLDIETTNLKANMGYMLAYCIKDMGSNTIYCDTLNKKDVRKYLTSTAKGDVVEPDKRILKRCGEDVKRFDRIVTWYGRRFDVPFLKTRCLIADEEFPFYGELIHDDLYFIARYKLCFTSNRLATVARALFGETQKTHFDGHTWLPAQMGDKRALDEVLDHCKRDVLELEKIYYKIINFARRADVSI
jgi:uncharacterized protein YprB with RNaseH-like and TPR domain